MRCIGLCGDYLRPLKNPEGSSVAILGGGACGGPGHGRHSVPFGTSNTDGSGAVNCEKLINNNIDVVLPDNHVNKDFAIETFHNHKIRPMEYEDCQHYKIVNNSFDSLNST